MKEVLLSQGKRTLAIYRPGDDNPRLRLAKGQTKDTFLAYWYAGTEYFAKNIPAILSGSPMDERDASTVQMMATSSLHFARDGRRTKAEILD